MNDQNGPLKPGSSTLAMSPWRALQWVCFSVVTISVLACVVMSAVRGVALTKITVTALDKETEPLDHRFPIIRQRDAFPDYEVRLILCRGGSVRLGAKPNSSAVDGLTWVIRPPVCVTHICSVRLQEQDKIISDPIAEVSISGESVTENGYRFDFSKERSFSSGLTVFFDLPIGKAISVGFLLAIMLLLLSSVSV